MNAFSRKTLTATLIGSIGLSLLAASAVPAAALVTCVLPGPAGSTVQCQACTDPGCHMRVQPGGGRVYQSMRVNSDPGSHGRGFGNALPFRGKR